MGSAAKSIVLKTKKALNEARANKKKIVEVKKECIEDLEVLNENLKHCNNPDEYNEVTTAISELTELRQKMFGVLQSTNTTTTVNDENVPSTSSSSEREIMWKDIQSAFENCIQTGVMTNKTYIDPKHFLGNCRDVFKAKTEHVFKNEMSLKINTVFCCEFKVIQDEEEKFELKYVDTKSASLYKYDNFENWYTQHIVIPLLNGLEELQEQASGWALSAVIDLKVNITKYTMLLGSSFVVLPSEIKVKKACVNVQNDDEACFAWAVVSAMYPCKSGSNRMNNYPYYESVLKLKGIKFPMTFNQIPSFERQNNLSINVFSLKLNTQKRTTDKFVIVPAYVSRHVKDKHISLMLIQNKYDHDDSSDYEDSQDLRQIKYHYVWIKHMSRLLSTQLSGHRSQKYICNRCLHYFCVAAKLTEHMKKCESANVVQICLPKKDVRDIEFTNYSKKKKAPFVIYAGLEYFFNKVKRYNQRVPCNVAYFVKCSYDPTLSFFKSYRGDDCISWLTRELQQFADDVSTVFICDYPRSKLTKLEEKVFKNTKKLCLCCVCEKPFTKSCRRVLNYCRFTGAYRGPAHEICNMNFRDSRTIPVFLHDLSDFDSHLLMKHFKSDFEGRIDINGIRNDESFITFTKRTDSPIKFRFIDSSQFMSGTLNTLGSYLTHFPVFRSQMSHLTDEQVRLLLNIIYPSSYIDSFAKFEEINLPLISEFGSITQEEYEHVKRLWKEFKLQNLGEYSDLCLKTNTLLLAEVFEGFRDICLEKYELDPSYYHTLPTYSWDVMLKQTKTTLELLTDIEMVTFIERGTRSGLSQCSMRHSKANNIYLEDYIYTKPSKYLIHFGVNYQYNWAMSQYLPYGKFKWVEDLTDFDVEAVPDNSLIGYVLEVDLEYPSDIHDLHKDLPFCPEYQVAPDFKTQTKLMATLHNKVKYVLHYRNLKQVLKHGLILTKVHRILQFEQSPWLKSYIDLNRCLSVSGKNDFERYLFELMSYSVFEKFVENIRMNYNLKLFTKWEGRFGAEPQISKPEFKSSTIISENLVILEMNSSEVYLNKPIYVGMCIQDLAKTRIYDFHYNYMQEKFGRYSCVCYIDTDSILYELISIDIYKLIKEDCEQQFDTSYYPHDNLWDIPRVNHKALGLINDRNHGRVISEFVGLRSKMYAVILDDRDKPMQLKGLNKEVVANRISFEDYVKCTVNGVQTEIALSIRDNKRYLMENCCETLPWGHYTLSK